LIDTGNTLAWVKKHFESKEVASFKLCCLLDKKARRIANVDVDYPVSNVELETCNSFWLDTRFYNFRPGIDGRMCLMQHGENITCSVTPVIKFLVELKPCNISNINFRWLSKRSGDNW